MYMETRDEEVVFIKKLIGGEETLCPKCKNAYLEHFHKKAKKSDTDYICPSCNERYRVIKMIDAIN